jgi:hypothetical protein
MYASIRRFEGIDRQTITEVARRGYADLRRILSERPGFVAYETVIGEDSYVTISVFESWATAEESNVVARRWIREHLGDLDWPEPQITAGEVYEEPGGGHAPFAPPARLKFQDPEVQAGPLVSVGRARSWLQRGKHRREREPSEAPQNGA